MRIDVWAKEKESLSRVSKIGVPLPGTGLALVYRTRILSHIQIQSKPYFLCLHRGKGKAGGGPAHSFLGAKD